MVSNLERDLHCLVTRFPKILFVLATFPIVILIACLKWVVNGPDAVREDLREFREWVLQ